MSVKKDIEILSGSISSGNTFFDICREIALPKWTGMLVIKAGKTKYNFYFREGEIIYSENSLEKTESKILEMIRRADLVSRETLSSSEKKKSKVMRTLLEILVEEGHVSMLLYSRVISTLIRLNILKAMLLKKGEYKFLERKTIREVHGVKPVSVLDINNIASVVDSYPAETKKILKNWYNNVSETKEGHYLVKNKSFLQSFLAREIDFLSFMAKAVPDYAKKEWQMQGLFGSFSAFQTILIYMFRSLAVFGIALFLYLVFMTGAFSAVKNPRSVEEFYFFKVKLTSSMISLETGSEPDKEQLIMSGLLTEKDIEISGIKDNNKP